jgi:putative oxidoreductase
MTFSATASQRQINIGLGILRAVVGAIFVAHAGQKLFVFGVDGVTAGFVGMGIPMASVAAPLVILAELFGGLALITGLLTRVAAASLALVMLGAIGFAHLSAGFFNPNGIEFPLMLLAAAATLVATGAGAFSLDARFFPARSPAVIESVPSKVRRAA